MAKKTKKVECVTATLVVQVSVRLNGENVNKLAEHLNDVVEHATNNGLITGESAMEVDNTDWHVLMGCKYEVK
jgi:anti-anti-sigma regulatory factor